MSKPPKKRRPSTKAARLSREARQRRTERHYNVQALRNLILDTRRQLHALPPNAPIEP
jgi:hypothetical protein